MLFKRDEVIKQLNLLGYKDNEKIYLRAIKKDGGARKIQAYNKNQIPWKQLEKLQQQNYNLYLVVNGAGNTDAEIKFGRAIFYEHDNLLKDIQRELWQKLKLPQPTFQIDTGGKSIHSYWVFDEPIAIEKWEKLQADLLEYANADRSIKNPSRVMRLAGSKHQNSQKLAAIISSSNKRYSYSFLRSLIPTPSAPSEPSASVAVRPPSTLRPFDPSTLRLAQDSGLRTQDIRTGFDPSTGSGLRTHYFTSAAVIMTAPPIPLENCLTKEHRNFLAGVTEGGRNIAGAALARDLIGTANRLNYLGIQYSGTPEQLFEEFCAASTPPVLAREAATIWKSASKSNPTACLTDSAIENCVKSWERSHKIPPSASHQSPPERSRRANRSNALQTDNGGNPERSRRGGNGGDFSTPPSTSLRTGFAPSASFGNGDIAPNDRPDPDEVFKLEVLAYSDEQNPFKKLRLKGQICANYRISAKELQGLVDAIKGRSTAPKAKRHTGAEFLLLETEGIKWLIPGIIPGRGVTILGGAPGAGKTTIAYDIAASILYQESFLGEDIDRPGKVLFVSSDEQPCFAQDKLINRGFTFNDQWQFVSDWDISQKQEFEKYLDDFRPQFVMVDSFAAIHQNENFDENSSQAKAAVYWLESMANKYGCAILLIHHCNKNREQKGVAKLRGSSAIAGACSAVLLLEGEGNFKSLSASKIRGSEPFKWDIKLDHETGRWSVVAGKIDDSAAKSLSEKIMLLFLSKYPTARLEVSEIREEVGGQFDSIYKALDRLCKRGLLIKRPSQVNRRFKVYGLPLIPADSQIQLSENTQPFDCAQDRSSESITDEEHSPPLTCVINTHPMSTTITECHSQTVDVTVDVTVDSFKREKTEIVETITEKELQTLDMTLDKRGGEGMHPSTSSGDSEVQKQQTLLRSSGQVYELIKQEIINHNYLRVVDDKNAPDVDDNYRINIEAEIDNIVEFIDAANPENVSDIQILIEIIKEVITTFKKKLSASKFGLFMSKMLAMIMNKLD